MTESANFANVELTQALEKAQAELRFLRALADLDQLLSPLDVPALELAALRLADALDGRQPWLQTMVGDVALQSAKQPPPEGLVVVTSLASPGTRALVAGPLTDSQHELIHSALGLLEAAASRAQLEREHLDHLAANERASLVQLLAHEANSPLASLISNLGFVQTELQGASPDAVEALRDCVDLGQRLSGIFKQLKHAVSGEYQRFSMQALLSAFDAGRGAQTSWDGTPGVGVLAEDAALLPMLEAAGRAAGARVTLAGVNGHSVVLSVADPAFAAPELPPELKAMGVAWATKREKVELSIPFRLIRSR